MKERRRPWYLLTGLLIGAVLGILLASILLPVQFEDVSPDKLKSAHRDIYRGLVALSFQADGDLERARVRLSLLQDADVANALAAHAQRLLAQGGSSREAQAVAKLAAALDNHPGSPSSDAVSSTPNPLPDATETELPPFFGTNTPTVTFTPMPPTGTPTLTVTPTPLSSPTRTPQPTFTPHMSPTSAAALELSFNVKNQKEDCDSSYPSPLLKVEVLDSTGKPLPGIRITVTWKDGQNAFYTGLHPDQSAGYADFVMTPDVAYSVRVGELGKPIEDVQTQVCKNKDGASFNGGWWITFTP